MNLPWFPFHIDKYLGHTMHLDTEGHGAYLLLMLHYYRTGAPPPDNDRALASICKLPLARWMDLRPLMLPFFVVADGVWRHERIEGEMLEASSKHAASIARASAAADARWRKKSSSNAPGMPQASDKDSSKHARSRKRASSNAPSMPEALHQASTEQCLENAHIHRTEEDAAVVGNAGARETDFDMGKPIEFWKPDRSLVEDGPQVLAALESFIAHHTEAGTFSTDWDAAWHRHRAEIAAKVGKPAAPPRRKAPPRIETTKRPDDHPPAKRGTISEEAFELAAEVAQAMGVDDEPITVGMPAQMETWLAGWPYEVILTTIREVMAKRRARGETEPPKNLKYFADAIARAFADRNRPLPVAAPTASPETAHGRRTTRQSLPEAARRVAAKLAAFDGGGTDHGGPDGGAVAGAIPHFGGE